MKHSPLFFIQSIALIWAVESNNQKVSTVVNQHLILAMVVIKWLKLSEY